MVRIYSIFALCCALHMGPKAHACTPDAALAQAAQTLVETGISDSHALLRAARAAGSDAPVVQALVLPRRNQRRKRAWLTRLREERASPLICAEAETQGRWLILAAPHAGSLTPSGTHSFAIWLAAGWQDAHVFARDAQGDEFVESVQDGSEVHIDERLVSPLTVQLIAEGPHGPQAIAVREIAPSAEAREIFDGPVTEEINQLRRRWGRTSLRDNRLFRRVARSHAREICRSAQIIHEGMRGDPERRLARAGIQARHVGEVLARAETTSDALNSLVQSPSHRLALHDRRFTDMGVGQASDRQGRVCVVVLLAAWPRPTSPVLER